MPAMASGLQQQPQPTGNRAALRHVFLAGAATLAIFAVAIAGWHNYVPDDVYFYLKVADSLHRGLGSTFNGLVPTNGYHPLWLGVTWLTRALSGPDPKLFIRLHFVVSALGNLVTLALVYRLCRALRLPATIAPVFVGLLLVYAFLGSEQHISMPLLLGCLLYAIRFDGSSTARTVLGGVLFGVTLLARLDNVFVVASLMLYLVLQATASRERVVRAAIFGSVTTIIVAPYLLWNWTAFHHLVPISGAIKIALAREVGWNPRKLGRIGQCLSIAALLAPWLSARFYRARACVAPVFFAAGAGVHAVYVLARMEAVWTWYFSSELIVSALLLEQALLAAIERAGAWLTRALHVLVPVTVVAATGLMLKQRLVYYEPKTNPFYIDAATWIEAHVPEGTGIVTCCSPGSLGFFVHRPIFAMDGLTGDYAFHERAAREGLYEALRGIGVRYMLSLGPRSIELPALIETTRVRGHGGESAAYVGKIDADGQAGETDAVAMWSALVGRRLGWLRTSPENLVGADFCERPMGLWTLEPIGEDSAGLPLGAAHAAVTSDAPAAQRSRSSSPRD